MDSEEQQKREVIEVEAERMPLPGEGGGSRGEALKRVKKGFGPVLAGVVIDAVDFTTPFPMQVSFAIGAAVGYWLVRRLGYTLRQSIIAATAAGVYCMFPPTRFFPLATIFGALAPLLTGDRSEESGAAE